MEANNFDVSLDAEADQNQLIQIMHDLYCEEQSIKPKTKTIILYSVYQQKIIDEYKNNKSINQKQESKKKKHLKNELIHLTNAHTFAQVILNKDITVKTKDRQQGKVYELASPDEQLLSQKTISRKWYKIQEQTIDESLNILNICAYERDQMRIVVLPIQRDFVQLQNVDKTNEEEENKIRNDIIKPTLAGDERKKAQSIFKQIQKERMNVRINQSKGRHLKITKLLYLITAFLSKTKQVSVVGLLEYNQKIQKQKLIQRFQKQTLNILEIKQFKPKSLVYISGKKNSQDSDSQQSDPSSQFKQNQVFVIFNLNSSPGKIHFDQLKMTKANNFYPPQKVKFKLYNKIRQGNDSALRSIIQHFIDTLSNIAANTMTTISFVFKTINSTIGQDQSIYKKFYTFKQIFKRYRLKQIKLPSVQHLRQFYTKQRLKLNKIEQYPIKIPFSIANITFLHYFKQVREKALNNHQKNRQNIENKLQMWIQDIKQMYQLINAVNTNLIPQGQRCEDMKLFYNFISFLLNIISKMENTFIPAFLDKFKSIIYQLNYNNDKIIRYITSQQNKISSQEQLIYYDLYNLIIKQNNVKTSRNNLDYIEIHLKQQKAHCIAIKYIYDEERIVQAIKDYAQVALRYKTLETTRKNIIPIQQIEIKMARLLNIIGQQTIAAKILLQLKMFGEAHKIYTQARFSYFGQARSNKLLEWGKEFQNQFQYDLAQQYYRQAYDSAQTNQLKVKVIQQKKICRGRLRREQTEEQMRTTQNYLKDGDFLGYTGQKNLQQIFQQMKQLRWNREEELSSFV